MSLPVLTDSLNTYTSEINRFPILSRDEELGFARHYYTHRDIKTAHKLVTSNLRFVVKIAFEYRHYGCNIRDLIQEGNLGLMTAVKKYDPAKGTRLLTYAVWWIRAFIQEFIIKTRGLVRWGAKALKKKLFYRNTSDADADTRGHAEPSLSLDTPISEGSETVTHMDRLMDPNPTQEEFIGDGEQKAIVKKEVSDALALLNEKERLVIERRVMSDEPSSLQALGDSLGLTRERIRQIEAKALKKLKGRLISKSSSEASLP